MKINALPKGISALTALPSELSCFMMNISRMKMLLSLLFTGKVLHIDTSQNGTFQRRILKLKGITDPSNRTDIADCMCISSFFSSQGYLREIDNQFGL